jgi:hypothetical protein
MITESLSLGSHLYFFRAGKAFTLPEPGTCSASAKPSAGDTGWVDLGRLKNVEAEKKSVLKEIWAASPGQLVRVNAIETKKAMDFTFTTQDMSDLMVEMAFGTAPLASGDTQFNPLEGTEFRGWLKGQIYDHRDELVLVVDQWCLLKCEGKVALNSPEGDIAEFSFMAMGLHSNLNTGTKRAS